MVRLAISALLVLLAVEAASAQAPANAKKAWPAYVLGIGLGYGTGHYYLGLDGTDFLIADLAGAISIGAGAAFIASALVPPGSNFYSGGSGLSTGIGLAAIGLAIYVTSRIWEGIDLLGAIDKSRRAGGLVGIEPVIDARRTSFEAGFAISY